MCYTSSFKAPNLEPNSPLSLLKPCTTELSDCQSSPVCWQCADEFWYTPSVSTDDGATTGDDTPSSEMSCADVNDEVCVRYGTNTTCTRNIEYEAFIGEDLGPIHVCTNKFFCQEVDAWHKEKHCLSIDDSVRSVDWFRAC